MDTMDFVKRAWATLDLSSPFKPTLSIEELDKRIADLRAVEQWLALNQGMLRNTIQGLEVQRGTLAAVQNLTDSFGRMSWPPGEETAEALARFAATTVQSPQAPTPQMPPPAPQMPPPAAQMPAGEAAGSAAGAAGADVVPPPPAWGGSVDPLGWWKVLQGNFEQIARMAVATPGADVLQPDAKATAKQGSAASKPSSKTPPARKTGTKPAPRRKGGQTARDGSDAAGASARPKSREER